MDMEVGATRISKTVVILQPPLPLVLSRDFLAGGDQQAGAVVPRRQQSMT